MPSIKSWMPQWRQKYNPIRHYTDDSDEEKSSTEAFLQLGDELGPHSSHLHQQGLSRRSSRCFLWGSLILNGGLLASTCFFATQAWPQIYMKLHDPFNNTLIKQVSMPSPILDEIHIPLTTTRRNGSLLPNHPPSLFRQDPSEEVDRAWHRLANINPIPISSQDVRNIGYDPDIGARWPDEYGLGDDAYVARLDVFHEIHCLDMLRREVHFEHYYAEERGWHKPSDATPDHKIHISHCIYALLQSLMCSANTDPFIHYWVDVGDEPYPDFSINRQCRDFEKVLEYQEEKSIPMSQFRGVIKKPKGVTPRIMSLEYKYMVGLIETDPVQINEAIAEAAGWSV